MSVKVKGADVLQALLGRLGALYTKPGAQQDLLESVAPTVRAAQGFLALGPPPYHIKENVGAAPTDPENGGIAAVAIGAFRIRGLGEAFYGAFKEFGTVKQAAEPWLRPAWDQTETLVVGNMAMRVGKRVVAAVRA